MESFAKAARWLNKIVSYYGGSYECNVCGMSLRRFVPFPQSIIEKARLAGFPYDFERAETLNFSNYSCPFCDCADRERLYLLYLNSLKPQVEPLAVLDFAPNKAFSKSIRSLPKYRYQSADFIRTDCDLQLDICSMSEVADCQFDIVICSHILEHVDSPARALQEIYRILKPAGFAIIMVPLFADVAVTIEGDPSESELVRLAKYGQTDHVRLFSKEDFVNYLGENFEVIRYGVESFSAEQIRKHAIAANTVLYTCHKSSASMSA